MTLFVFLLLALIVVAMFYVNQTKLDQAPAPKPVQKTPIKPAVEAEPAKSHWRTYRTRYVIAIVLVVLLIASTVVESVFFS